MAVASGIHVVGIYMVLPFMDHDLAGILETCQTPLEPSHVKCYFKQLMEGLNYIHSNGYMHRDIKCSNTFGFI